MQCQNNVLETQLDEPVDVHVVYADRSEMVFKTVLGFAEPRIVGETGSMAWSLNDQAAKYTYLAGGVMIKFKDGSSCTLNLGRKITDPSVAPRAASPTFA
jgi:hypothetical protein